jgi:hypothetical protein
MNLSKLFPLYPVRLISPRGGNIKIASRKVYVDFPYVFWNFMGEVAQEISKSNSPQQFFENQLKLFTSNEEIRKIITFNNIPLGSISLFTNPFTSKLLLKLKVNWRVFFQYLDHKAKELISKIEIDGSSIREVYNEITDNYFKLFPIKPDPKIGRFNNYALENFKKLLRRQREDQNIQLSLLGLKRIIKGIEQAIGLDSIELWTLQLESDVYAIEKCLENVDILACYFYLRNLLENFIKLVVYNTIAKNFNVYNGMIYVFFFYEKTAKEKPNQKRNVTYGIRELESKYVRRIARYLGSEAENIDLEKIYLMMIEKQFPKLSINKQTLEEFQKVYSINLPIKNYWSACSEIIHNQSPLPFFSLLEVKAFSQFLKRYVKCLSSMVKSILGVSEELIEETITHESFTAKRILTKNAKQILRQLTLQKGEEIEKILKLLIQNKSLREESFFDPLTLLSLFHLSSPSWTQVYSGEFGIDDIEYLMTKIQPLSFSVKGILQSEFHETLQILEEKIIPEIEQISSDFSKLKGEEKNAIAFYLLVMKLSELFKVFTNRIEGVS